MALFLIQPIEAANLPKTSTLYLLPLTPARPRKRPTVSYRTSTGLFS